MLKVALPEAHSQLTTQIEEGRELIRTLPAGRADRDRLLQRLNSWRDYNRTWIGENLGEKLAQGYTEGPGPCRSGSLNGELPKTTWKNLCADVDQETAQLESFRRRLHLWAPPPRPSSEERGAPEAPIFIVHGSDTGAAAIVARAVDHAVRRETTILHERANSGRVLIEKFEAHAARVSYAIIILTPDDHGARAGTADTRPRGRQNVIFEMGYFFGLIGRSKVSILLYPGVEKPSDTDGIVYIRYDESGSWKAELYRELSEAGFDVNWA
jgi:hypothetical protein